MWNFLENLSKLQLFKTLWATFEVTASMVLQSSPFSRTP